MPVAVGMQGWQGDCNIVPDMNEQADDLRDLPVNDGQVKTTAPVDFRAQRAEQEVEVRAVEMGISVADTEQRDDADDSTADR